jgi:hypothetical protein
VCHGDPVVTCAIGMQLRTQRPVQFEIMAATREALQCCSGGTGAVHARSAR